MDLRARIAGWTDVAGTRLSRRAPGLARPGVWFAIAAAALVPLTWHRVWQRPPFLPIATFDASWQAALHLAAHQRLGFGSDLVFPYGPLGFLAIPVLYFPWTAALAFCFVTVARLALSALVLRAALRSFPWPLAALLAYVVGTLPIWDSDLPLLVLFFGSVAALERPSSPAADLLIGLAGPLAACQLLVKTNVGIVAVVLVVVAAAALPTVRGLVAAWLPASFAATFVLLWVVSGNDLGDVPRWLHAASAFVGGYSQGLALEAPGLHWNYYAAAAILALLAYVVWRHGADYPPRRRIGLLLLAVVFAYGYFKEGFVRHDVHATFFFGAVATAAVAFGTRSHARWLAALVVALGVAAVLHTAHASLAGFFRPDTAARAYGFEARSLVQSGRRQALRARSAAEIRQQLALDPATLQALEGHTVHVDPYATSAVWAYGFRWRPLPVFQENVVDTQYLDHRNASFLESQGAPERVLRENVPTVDGESPELEAPATFLAMVCRYVQVRATERWQVLARTTDRCGQPRRIGSLRVAPGEDVRVPAAGAQQLVFARIKLHRPLLRRIVDAIYKPTSIPAIVLDGSRRFRFRPTTAGDPQVLRIPHSAGYSPAFGGALDTGRFRLVHWSWSYRVDFYAVSLAPSRG